MRNKVYGKKARNAADVNIGVFAQITPEAIAGAVHEVSRQERPPLGKRSGNVLKGRTPMGRQCTGDILGRGQQTLDSAKKIGEEDWEGNQPKSPQKQQSIPKWRRDQQNLGDSPEWEDLSAKSDIDNVERKAKSRRGVESSCAVIAVDEYQNIRTRHTNEYHQTTQEISSSTTVEDLTPLLLHNLVIGESLSYTRSEQSPVIAIPPENPATILQQPTNLDPDTLAYISPLLQCKNVSQCVENFQAWTNARESILEIQKIGEGSFGEVYRANGVGETVIMKLVPLNARKGRGSRTFTSIESAGNEIQLLEKMQTVPGFVEFRGACILRGKMPSQLVKEWDEYKAQGKTVESKNPNKKDAYAETQLWLLIEMSDAGINLSPGQYHPRGTKDYIDGQKYLCVARTWDIFWQIVRALAKAEVYSEFEHRDLHLGNICVRDISLCNEDKDENEDLTLVHRDESTTFRLDHTGVEVTIIDYSLSRAIGHNDRVLFYDFKKNNSILRGEGDLQYDIYRYMADELGESSCKESVPKTNVLWLSYLLIRLLEVTQDLSEQAKTVVGEHITVAAKMKLILEQVKNIISLKKRQGWELVSAGDVLELGTVNGWFLVEDIVNT
ncbi:hypothetical protein MMC19_007683 [Ptychographa xylographoides]|nr:hypothetical protein [Ptychographa xylographoides]